MTLERAKVIDFSMSFHQEPTGILIPAPMPGNKLTILVRPLKLEVGKFCNCACPAELSHKNAILPFK